MLLWWGAPGTKKPGAAAPGLVPATMSVCYVQSLARAPGPVKAKLVYTTVGLTPARLTDRSETDNPIR